MTLSPSYLFIYCCYTITLRSPSPHSLPPLPTLIFVFLQRAWELLPHRVGESTRLRLRALLNSIFIVKLKLSNILISLATTSIPLPYPIPLSSFSFLFHFICCTLKAHKNYHCFLQILFYYLPRYLTNGVGMEGMEREGSHAVSAFKYPIKYDKSWHLKESAFKYIFY